MTEMPPIATAGSDDVPEWVAQIISDVRAIRNQVVTAYGDGAVDILVGSPFLRAGYVIAWLADDRERLLDKLECAKHERDGHAEALRVTQLYAEHYPQCDSLNDGDAYDCGLFELLRAVHPIPDKILNGEAK